MVFKKKSIDQVAMSKYVALAFCNEIREESYRNISFGMRCRRCMDTAEDGIPAYLTRKPGLRGCEYVNRKFEEMMTDTS